MSELTFGSGWECSHGASYKTDRLHIPRFVDARCCPMGFPPDPLLCASLAVPSVLSEATTMYIVRPWAD